MSGETVDGVFVEFNEHRLPAAVGENLKGTEWIKISKNGVGQGWNWVFHTDNPEQAKNAFTVATQRAPLLAERLKEIALIPVVNLTPEKIQEELTTLNHLLDDPRSSEEEKEAARQLLYGVTENSTYKEWRGYADNLAELKRLQEGLREPAKREPEQQLEQQPPSISPEDNKIFIDQRVEDLIRITLENGERNGFSDKEKAEQVAAIRAEGERAKKRGFRGEEPPPPPLTKEEESHILEEANHGKIGWTDWTQPLIDIWRAGDMELSMDKGWEAEQIAAGLATKNPDGTFKFVDSERPSVKVGINSIKDGKYILGTNHASPLYIRTNDIRKLVLEHHAKVTTSHNPVANVEDVHDIQTTLSRAQGLISANGIYDRRYGLDYSAITEAAQGWLHDPLGPLKQIQKADSIEKIKEAIGSFKDMYTKFTETFNVEQETIYAKSQKHIQEYNADRKKYLDDVEKGLKPALTVRPAEFGLQTMDSDEFVHLIMNTPPDERNLYIRQIGWMAYGLTKDDAFKAANGQMDRIQWKSKYGLSKKDALEMRSRPWSNSPVHVLVGQAETIWYGTLREMEFYKNETKGVTEPADKLFRLDQAIIDKKMHHRIWDTPEGNEVLKNVHPPTFWERMPPALDQKWEMDINKKDREWEAKNKLAQGQILKNPDGTYSLANSERPSLKEGNKAIEKDIKDGKEKLVFVDSKRPSVKVGLRVVDPDTGKIVLEEKEVYGTKLVRKQRVVPRLTNVKLSEIKWVTTFKPQDLVAIVDLMRNGKLTGLTAEHGFLEDLNVFKLLDEVSKEHVAEDLKDELRTDNLLPLIDIAIEHSIKEFNSGNFTPGETDLRHALKPVFVQIRDHMGLNFGIPEVREAYIALFTKYKHFKHNGKEEDYIDGHGGRGWLANAAGTSLDYKQKEVSYMEDGVKMFVRL